MQTSYTFPIRYVPHTIDARQRRDTLLWRLWFACLLGVTGAVGWSMLRSGPDPAMAGWLAYWAGVAAILYQPRLGVYLIVGLTLAGDQGLTYWYPFTRNFSSAESLLFAGSGLIFSPLETYIALTYVAWLGRAAVRRKLEWHGGPLLWPALVFIGFITLALARGMTNHGDRNIALWETRAIYYLAAILVLTTNLIQTRAQANWLIWMIIAGLSLRGLTSTWVVATVLQFNFGLVENIAMHTFSIHAASFVVLALGAWIYRASYGKRIVLTLMLPFVLIGFIANQRRAGYVALILALALLALVLYRERRIAFWLIVPACALLGALYVGAFWNNNGPAGMPARAVKSVIAPDSVNARDSASNQYRVIENFDIMFTIRAAPLLGTGFGHKFYQIIPLPDISHFVWWEYIPHNSIMWIWINAGAGGFTAMLFLAGYAILLGARALWRMPGDELSLAALAATLYLIMHFVFAYVDMSWEPHSMTYVGAMMGLVNGLERMAARQEPAPPKRWPWQPEPAPAPGLRL